MTLKNTRSIACLAFIAGLASVNSHPAAAQPIRLHPDNPRWLEWRGRTTPLITSAEHYGAVLNPDFDFHRYLETLERDGMNYTRIFSGSYVEPPGAFGITRNTLAPAPGRFLAPWARSDQPGCAGGGNKFDLDQFSPQYLDRLKTFLREAGQRGIVVELTLFCSTYSEAQWALHPFNPTNHIQATAVPSWKTIHTLPIAAPEPTPPDQLQQLLASTPLGPRQQQLTRWLVRELNDFDNLFFEIQNEPWSDNHTMGDFINPYLTEKHDFPNAVEITTPQAVAWQRAIARVITDEESRLPHRHLIAQNTANFRLPLNDGDLVPEAGLVHFHYAYPEAVAWNSGLPRAIGYDETGFAGNADATYRKQAWNFILSGGALFNNLDYSFTVGRENGTDVENRAPGGGSPELRRQLKTLRLFLDRFDLATLQPDATIVRRAPGVVVRALSAPGKACAIYLEGRGPTTLSVQLANGQWTAEWFAVEDGRELKRQALSSHGAPTDLLSPAFTEAVALRLSR